MAVPLIISISASLRDCSGKASRNPRAPGALRLIDLMEEPRPEPPRITFDTSRDLEVVLFTVSTTGVVAGSMLTHRNDVPNSIQSSSRTR